MDDRETSVFCASREGKESGQIALKAGTYPIRITFYQGMGGKGLEVSYKGPGVEKQQIPPQALFHAEEGG